MFTRNNLLMPRTTVGLLGGSFDPPHKGHLHITKQAFSAFRLNQVWWLVSPGNPLKSNEPATLSRRIMACREIIKHPNVIVSDIESHLNTRFTADTLSKLMALYPRVKFVWLMGADNLADFHKWEKWNWIMENIPVGVMARHGEQLKAGLSRAAFRYRNSRLSNIAASRLPHSKAPVWTLIGGPMYQESSTEIRSKGSWY